MRNVSWALKIYASLGDTISTSIINLAVIRRVGESAATWGYVFIRIVYMYEYICGFECICVGEFNHS